MVPNISGLACRGKHMVGKARRWRAIALVAVASWVAACAASPASPDRVQYSRGARPGAEPRAIAAADAGTAFDTGQNVGGSVIVDRKIVRNGDLAVELDDLAGAQKEVERAVAEIGGYVERSSTNEDESVFVSCRVPAEKLDAIMDRIAALGKQQRRSTSASDVTDAYADLETRIRHN